jgi:hypothetical protein
MNEELWKNKEYVELIKKAFKKIDEGLGSTFIREGAKGKTDLLNPTLANRAKSALLAQPNLEFLPKLKKYIDSPAGLLAHAIKSHESGVLRDFQFVKGMEGHHWLHQNVMQWFKNIPVERALEVMKRFRDEGGTSGVVWENLFPLSRRGHSAGNLLGDAANQAVSAHLNPITSKADTGLYSTFDRATGSLEEGKAFKAGEIFNKDDSIEFMVDTIRNYAYDPGKRLTEIAAENPSEKTARKFLSKLAGTNLENIKDPSILKKYRMILSQPEGWGVDLNDLIKHISAGGELPDLDKIDMKAIDEGRGGLFKLLAQVKSNPNLRLSEISRELSKLNKLKPALKAGGRLPVAGKFIKGAEVGLELLTGIPVLADVTRETKSPFEEYYEGERSGLYDLANVADAGSLVTGLAAIPSGGISVIPSFGLGLLGWGARTAAEGHKKKHEEIFYRYLKKDKHIPANTETNEYGYEGVAEIKQWDPEKERIERIKNLTLNSI